MSDNQHGDDLRRTVGQHDKDLYRGDQRKPGLTTRMEQMEEWKESLDSQLNGSYGKPGLLGEMRTFFAIQANRETTEEKRSKRYVLLVAALAILIPIGYDLIKHAAGWK